MATVEIEYCVPCGMLDRALTVEEAILQQFADDLDRVSLVMGDHGIFVVRVDDEVVFDKEEDGFDVDEIVRRVRSQLSA
ncbi:SelT/SelW/SelH family protein [Halonotius terrestris]|uniref:SelT/SelW/SelH family protein n=1 Tax=Halonotius terrestris TaxID=2487750 RepID=A0A8J8PBF5_9EURY|nr:Rdx family protein [Halonotius terrestris]TQQ83519.1 SelT/SelW/SelH family protein [Halonotius terrestris]